MNPLQRALNQVAATEEMKRRAGERLSLERQRRQSRGKRLRRLAAACALLALAGAGMAGWKVYQTPVSFISIDVNPSLELGVNRMDRVVQTTAYNADGAEIAGRLALENQTYQQAIDCLLADPVFRSYLSEEAGVFFTVVSEKQAQMEREIAGLESYQSCRGQLYASDLHCLGEAHENGLSVGKYRAYLELSQYDQTVTVEDCHDLTMDQIQRQIQYHHSHQEDQPGCHEEETGGPVSGEQSQTADTGTTSGHGHHDGHH